MYNYSKPLRAELVSAKAYKSFDSHSIFCMMNPVCVGAFGYARALFHASKVRASLGEVSSSNRPLHYGLGLELCRARTRTKTG